MKKTSIDLRVDTFRNAKMHIWKSPKNKKWYFTLKSGNGKKVAQSEGYKTRAMCIKTASNIANLSYWAVYIIEDSK